MVLRAAFAKASSSQLRGDNEADPHLTDLHTSGIAHFTQECLTLSGTLI